MKIRPQIIMAMAFITLSAGFAMWIGWRMEANEIVTGALGSMGVVGILAMKLLEGE